MNRALAQTVVACLGFSGEKSIQFEKLRRFSSRDWKRTLGWLDASGLALYFLQEVDNCNARAVVPTEILVWLDKHLASNRKRVVQLAGDIAEINQRFGQAHIKYAIIKGFSLVPLFCSDIALRVLSDVDYLIDEESRDRARDALVEVGYKLGDEGSIESRFEKPQMRIATRSDNSYAVRTKVGIELHTAIWSFELIHIPFAEPKFSLDRPHTQHWRDLAFPVLNDLEIFVLQLVHAFHHVLEGWVKMSWLFEIGYFLKQQESNESFWNTLEQYAASMPQFREFCAIVIRLASNIFGCTVPLVVEKWIAEMHPAAKLWINKYGRAWAFENHPYQELSLLSASKLVLFLHELYAPDAETRKRIRDLRLFPWKRPPSVAAPIKGKPATTLQARFLQSEHVVRRLIFHATTGSRYLWELPRWRMLNRQAE
ncbi:MAG: hypothetical protein JWO91_2776 [Acidobacteriaceae bacterium]|nr:hypothetical protein [Acidobacteriaceae bacterium]